MVKWIGLLFCSIQHFILNHIYRDWHFVVCSFKYFSVLGSSEDGEERPASQTSDGVRGIAFSAQGKVGEEKRNCSLGERRGGKDPGLERLVSLFLHPTPQRTVETRQDLPHTANGT